MLPNDVVRRRYRFSSIHANCQFNVIGKIYHKAGFLLPLQYGQHKFLQMYFIGDGNDESNARCVFSTGRKISIVSHLEKLLLEKNFFLERLFKTAIDMMPSDTHKLVIHVDKTPAGQVRRFNAPTIDEAAIVIVGDQFQPRDIVLHRRNH